MDGISKNTTYILDIPSMAWTKGPAVDASQSRSAMACSVSGDNFVIWGGMNVVLLFCMKSHKDYQLAFYLTPANDLLFLYFFSTGIRKTGLDPANYTTLDTTPLIFNLHFGQWVQKFERGTHYTPLPVAPASPISPPKPEGTSAPDKEKSSVGDIVGGTLGGVLVLALMSASYIAHKKPQLLRQLICWGKEPDEQPRSIGLFPPTRGLQPPTNPLPANNNNSVNNDIDKNIRGNRLNTTQHSPPEPPQDHPQDSGASTSPPGLAATRRLDINVTALSIQPDLLQHPDPPISMNTEFPSDPPRRSLTTAEPSAPPPTATLPLDEPPPFKGDSELQGFNPKSPSRGSTNSSTTTLHAPDSPPTSTSTSRPRVPSITSSPPNSTRPTHRNSSISFEAWSNNQINTRHSPTTDYVLTSDGSAPSVPHPLAIGVLLNPPSVQSDSSSVRAEVTRSNFGSQPPKEPAHSKSSSSSSSYAPPVPKKPEHLALNHMNDMRVASRQQYEGEILTKSVEGSNNHGTDQRPDTKNVSSTTATKSTGRQAPSATTSTPEAGAGEPQYPPRRDETTTRTSTRHRQQQRDTSASEPFAIPVALHRRKDPDVVAAPRSDASLPTLTVVLTKNTTTPRQPQGGHEPARTSSRSPQNFRGFGARKATFGDETPKSSVQKPNEDDEKDDLKKFQ